MSQISHPTPTITTFFISACIFFTNLGIAQVEKNHWHFGLGAGLDFSNGQPKVKNDGILFSHDGLVPGASVNATTVTDPKTGNMLFYTDGMEIIDASFSRHPTPLFNRYSLGDVLVIPKKTPHTYQVFGIAIYGADIVDTLIYFDVEVNGTNVKIGSPKVLVTDVEINRLTAVKNCENTGYWLLTYDTKGGDFLAFAIDSNNLVSNTPVKSNTSTHLGLLIDHLVSNNSGDLLAIAEYNYTDRNSDNDVFIFEFDKVTGIVNEIDQIISGKDIMARGMAFSPESDFLYIGYFEGDITEFEPKAKLVQYDIQNRKPEVIADQLYQMTDMEPGPDGKIYIIGENRVAYRSSWLHTINHPNRKGKACGFTHKSIFLGTNRTTKWYFPNFLQDYGTEPVGIRAPGFSIDSICLGDDLEVKSIDNRKFPESWTWVVNKQDTLSGKLPRFTPDSSGLYQLQFKFEHKCGADSALYEAQVDASPTIDLGPDTAICPGGTFRLFLPQEERTTYTWQPSALGSKPNVELKKAGLYTVEASRGACRAVDSFNLTVHPKVWVELGDEYFICDDHNDLVKLDAGKGFSKYLWRPTNDTTQWIHVSIVDSYYVIVDDFRGCKGEDGTRVGRRCPPSLYFANAFTPNGDNVNDDYAPIGQDLTTYQLEIYNRWGECIYRSHSPTESWDGTFKGKPSPPGQYLWKCSYGGFRTTTTKEFHSASGFVDLIR